MSFEQPTSAFTKDTRTLLCSVLFFGGLWKPLEKPKWFQNLYAAYSVVLLTIFSLIYTLAMVINIFLLTNFSDLSNRLFISLTEAALVIKVYNFLMNNREWQKILSEIETFRTKSAKDEEILRERAGVSQMLISVYFCNCNFAVTALLVITLVGGATDLMFSGWYPGFDIDENRLDFWIVFLYQYVGMMITANVNIAIDSYYCFVMHILSAQANIIGHRMSSIDFDDTTNSVQEVRMTLIRQINAHQHQNTVLALIQRNLQWAYFSQILMSSIVICSTTREFARVRT